MSIFHPMSAHDVYFWAEIARKRAQQAVIDARVAELRAIPLEERSEQLKLRIEAAQQRMAQNGR